MVVYICNYNTRAWYFALYFPSYAHQSVWCSIPLQKKNLKNAVIRPAKRRIMSEEEKKNFQKLYEQQIADSENRTLEEGCPCCHKKSRSESEEKDLITRLNRIEGQIRGIRKMVENDAYCVDILTQVSAASCALNSFTKVLLSNHIKTCVTEDIRAGKEEKVDELVKVLQKLMK